MKDENPVATLRTGVKAFAYALNQWPALTYYADDGWAEADNNIAEKCVCGWSVWAAKLPVLRFGSWRRAGSAAVQPDRDVQTERSGAESYLRYVLDAIADWPIKLVGELLPGRSTAD